MKNIAIVSLVSLIFATSCNTKETSKTTMDIVPPKADKIAKSLEISILLGFFIMKGWDQIDFIKNNNIDEFKIDHAGY